MKSKKKSFASLFVPPKGAVIELPQQAVIKQVRDRDRGRPLPKLNDVRTEYSQERNVRKGSELGKTQGVSEVDLQRWQVRIIYY